jgi:hypothetical protein
MAINLQEKSIMRPLTLDLTETSLNHASILFRWSWRNRYPENFISGIGSCQARAPKHVNIPIIFLFTVKSTPYPVPLQISKSRFDNSCSGDQQARQKSPRSFRGSGTLYAILGWPVNEDIRRTRP